MQQEVVAVYVGAYHIDECIITLLRTVCVTHPRMTGSGWCRLCLCVDVQACSTPAGGVCLCVCVFVCVCLCVCVCVSRLQPHVWWIPLVAARQWHDLLPRSGADWLQYRPYINLVGEKKKRWKDGESRHSTVMGRATKYTSLLPDDNSPERLEWESDISMQLFLSSSCYCYQTQINES